MVAHPVQMGVAGGSAFSSCGQMGDGQVVAALSSCGQMGRG